MIRAALVALLCCLQFAAARMARCAEQGDYAVSLGHGYELVRANSHEIFISDSSQHVIIPGKISKYAIVKRWVVGYVGIPDWNDPEAKKLFSDVTEGYFLLDTSTNKVLLGLTAENLTKELNKRGISTQPTLEAPRHP